MCINGGRGGNSPFYPETLSGMWEENISAQHSLVIKAISRTAKFSVRKINGSFVHLDSVSCGCCCVTGEGCCFQGGLSVLLQLCLGDDLPGSRVLLGSTGSGAWGCSSLARPGSSAKMHSCGTMPCRNKENNGGNEGSLEFTDWELLFSSFWVSFLPLYC